MILHKINWKKISLGFICTTFGSYITNILHAYILFDFLPLLLHVYFNRILVTLFDRV